MRLSSPSNVIRSFVTGGGCTVLPPPPDTLIGAPVPRGAGRGSWSQKFSGSSEASSRNRLQRIHAAFVAMLRAKPQNFIT
jgi:hypothetical protein